LTIGDQVGAFIIEVGADHYVVSSPNWDGAAADAGAATWGNGVGGTVGAVSAANSLVGSTAGDGVGNDVTELSNGNYVVTSSNWNVPGGAADVGAVTWGNGTTAGPRTVGAVSATNSLIGSTAGDEVGFDYITPLSNGNYVVSSPEWDGVALNVGAVTWGNGNTAGPRTVGAVSAANSLVGSSANDSLGNTSDSFNFFFGITVLDNGNYVVASPDWNVPGGAVDVGAATWCNGIGGTVGPVSAANSLIGSTAGDKVGKGGDFFGVTALIHGNYVVSSSNWDGAAVDVGAVTWGNGSTAGPREVGAVSAANSLVGSTSGDQVGKDYITPLSTGNYVVGSPDWNIPGGAVDVGAATWGNGVGGTVGAVSSVNSLVGSTANDRVGDGGNFVEVAALNNGNYVVSSPNWDGAAVDVGAVTWGNGSTAGPRTVGAVSATNSLIGSTAGDGVGLNYLTPLSNGNYVVSSPEWDGVALNVGAVTWGNGSTAGPRTVGAVSAANSLVGSTANDGVGDNFITGLTNGNYVVSSMNWDTPGGGAMNVGAVTWGNGSTAGLRTVGAVSASNSLIGSTAGDGVGDDIIVLSNGDYLISSYLWDNPVGSIIDARALTYGNGATGSTTGSVATANSVLGTVTGGLGDVYGDETFSGYMGTSNYDPIRTRTFVGRGSSRILSILTLTLTSSPGIGSPTSTAITTTGATLGGNLTADGGSAITERGVVFAPTATDSDPNVGDPGVTKAVLGGNTLGVFIRVVTGLSSATAYSFKAYAINANGTSHTTVGTFTTSGTVDPAFSPSNPPKIIRLVGGAVSVSSVGIPSRTYGVQRSINLSSWTQIGTPMAAANGAVTLTDPTPPQPRAFYRLIFPAQ
jgi:hypothetical protein